MSDQTESTSPLLPPSKELGLDPIAIRTRHVSRIDKERQNILRAYIKASEKSFMVFLRGLRIASQFGPQVFDQVAAEYQMICFKDMAPSIQALRDGQMPPKRRFWIERTKKASKDADLAVIVAWLVGFCTRPFYGQIGAADREQAGIVRDRLSALLVWNPWLNDRIELVGSEIRSKLKRPDGLALGYFAIKSADVAGAHGGTPDLLILNELSHIKRWEFAENLVDNADGVAQGVVIVATNAGFKGSKAWKWRENAVKSPEWVLHILARPAPWHSAATVEDAKQRNDKSRYQRLWWGAWVSPVSSALTEEELDSVFKLKGPTDPEKGDWVYVAGLDLGISHDHAAFSILGVSSKERKIKLCLFKRWIPPVGGKINLIEVRDYVERIARHYNLYTLYYDPYQAELMTQELRHKRIRCTEMTFSSSTNLTRMATAFLQVVKGGELYCYDEEEIVRIDFGKFVIVDKGSTFRLDAVSDESGHADVGTSIIIALPAALEMLEITNPLLAPDDVIVYEREEDLTKEEIKALPDDLAAIYQK